NPASELAKETRAEFHGDARCKVARQTTTPGNCLADDSVRRRFVRLGLAVRLLVGRTALAEPFLEYWRSTPGHAELCAALGLLLRVLALARRAAAEHQEVLPRHYRAAFSPLHLV